MSELSPNSTPEAAKDFSWKQKLEQSEINVENGENKQNDGQNAEDSEVNYALDLALQTVDDLEKAKAGAIDPKEAIAFADAQLPVLYRVYEKMPGDNTPDKTDLAKKIREITEALADLSAESTSQDIETTQTQIAKM